MPGLQIKVDTSKGQAMLRAINIDFDKKEYLTLIGSSLIYWVTKNFKDEGTEAKWKPLADSTKAARRMSGRGAKILQDTGRLKQSFVDTYSIQGDWVQVGSEDPRSEWHHKGTSPYTIYPKNKKMLSFTVAGGRVFVKKVNHPGLPARPILPSEKVAEGIALKSMDAYVNLLVNRHKGAA